MRGRSKSPGMGEALTGRAEHHQRGGDLQPRRSALRTSSEFLSREAAAPHPTFTSASPLPPTRSSAQQGEHLSRAELGQAQAGPRSSLSELTHPVPERLWLRRERGGSGSAYFIPTAPGSLRAHSCAAAEPGCAHSVPSEPPRARGRSPAWHSLLVLTPRSPSS